MTDADLEMIPKIKRSQISLTKFLGSGAFGEVYEGLVKELDSVDGVEVKRAVKTLRKGATDSEKLEFLKEAKLMFNFKHEHILSLNAICLDNDPNFLILELMEGGDLLSFLRQNINKETFCISIKRGRDSDLNKYRPTLHKMEDGGNQKSFKMFVKYIKVY